MRRQLDNRHRLLIIAALEAAMPMDTARSMMALGEDYGVVSIAAEMRRLRRMIMDAGAVELWIEAEYGKEKD